MNLLGRAYGLWCTVQNVDPDLEMASAFLIWGVRVAYFVELTCAHRDCQGSDLSSTGDPGFAMTYTTVVRLLLICGSATTIPLLLLLLLCFFVFYFFFFVFYSYCCYCYFTTTPLNRKPQSSMRFTTSSHDKKA